jgi:hypothetical protein
MANVTRTTVWTDNQVLTASALNGEFNHLLDSLVLSNSDIASNAGIVYSKLDLTSGILNADISASAAIVESKLSFDTTDGHSHNGSDSKLIQVNRAFSWYLEGTLYTGTNFGPRYIVPENMTIKKVWLITRTAPTGANLTIDINKNGTTIWSTQGNRASITASATTGNTTTFDTTALVAGDYLDFDIDVVGSSVSGTDLTVVLECSQP